MSIGQQQNGGTVNTLGVRTYIYETQSPAYNATDLIPFRYAMSEQLVADVNKWIEYEPRVREQLGNSSGNSNIAADWLQQPAIGLNQFYYPMGAQRFACFRGMMTGAEYETLSARFLNGNRKYCWFHIERIVAGTVAQPIGLPLKTGANQPRISTPMRILQPIRYSAIAGGEALWLITLVDERYAWQRVKQAGDYTALSVPTAILESLQLNPSSTVSIPTAAVDSGACGCGSALANSGCGANLSGVSFDLVNSAIIPAGGNGVGGAIDVILGHQGKVLVRSFNGDYSAVKMSASNTACLANHDANSFYTYEGGRVFASDACGLPVQAYDILPKSFAYTVGYADYENGVAIAPSGVTDTYGTRFRRTTITFDINDLFNTPYSNISSSDAAKFYGTASMTDTILKLYTTSGLPADADDVADNNELVRDVALTSAANYCDALLAPVEASYRGVAWWPCDGASDVLWDLNGPEPKTRVERRSAWYALSEFYRKLKEVVAQGGASGSGNCTCPNFCTPLGEGLYLHQNNCCTYVDDTPCNCDELVDNCGPGRGPQTLTLTIEHYDSGGAVLWTNTVTLTGEYGVGDPTYTGTSVDTETSGYVFGLQCALGTPGGEPSGWQLKINSGGLFCCPWSNGGALVQLPSFGDGQTYNQSCSPFVLIYTTKNLPYISWNNCGADDGSYTVCTVTL